MATLNDTVISGGYCIGCGVCASIPNSPVSINMNRYGCLQAVVNREPVRDEDVTMKSVCPFSENSVNEDIISSELFSNSSANKDNLLGYYLDTYAGSVSDSRARSESSSGGLGTWIAMELKRRGVINGVIHVRNTTESDRQTDKRLFKYAISSTEEEIHGGAKTKYYPIELSEVLAEIRKKEGKYLLVGLPCFIKGVRLLARVDEEIREKIILYMGLVCGHLKSENFSSLFSWQCGIEPKNLYDINFRLKLPLKKANQYGVEVSSNIGGKSEYRRGAITKLYGTNWGYGFFKYNACDYCDDVVSETADVTIGDAWLPEYIEDSKGTNILIVRNLQISSIIKEGIDSGELALKNITANEVIKSQEAGFRHRRQGLSYRLYLKDQAALWRPIKRVDSVPANDERFAEIQRQRLVLAKESHIAFVKAVEKNEFKIFRERMDPLIYNYEKFYTPLWRRWARRIKYTILILLGKRK